MPKEGSVNTNSALGQKAKGERKELEPGARTAAHAWNRGVKPRWETRASDSRHAHSDSGRENGSGTTPPAKKQ